MAMLDLGHHHTPVPEIGPPRPPEPRWLPSAGNPPPPVPNATPEPDGPQNAAERPDGEPLRLVPLAAEALAMTAEQAARLPLAEAGDVPLVVVKGHALGPRYPAGSLLGFRPGEIPEPGELVAVRLSTGHLAIGRSRRYRGRAHVELESVDGVPIPFEVTPGPDGQPLAWSQARYRTAAEPTARAAAAGE